MGVENLCWEAKHMAKKTGLVGWERKWTPRSRRSSRKSYCRLIWILTHSVCLTCGTGSDLTTVSYWWLLDPTACVYQRVNYLLAKHIFVHNCISHCGPNIGIATSPDYSTLWVRYLNAQWLGYRSYTYLKSSFPRLKSVSKLRTLLVYHSLFQYTFSHWRSSLVSQTIIW